MRVAAIYDLHGNLPATEAVLAEIQHCGVDLILVGGDVAGGPMPRQTLDLLMTLGERALFVRGNGDRELVQIYDRLGSGDANGEDEANPKDPAMLWTARQITADHRDFLATFEEKVIVEVEGVGSVLFCHGSPRDDDEIITRVTPEARMRRMLEGVEQQVVVCGHIHVQFDRTIAGKRVVNAGSVGMPYEGTPGAYWALLGPEVILKRTVYDFERAAELVRGSGHPLADELAAENILTSESPEVVSEYFENIAREREKSGGLPPEV